MSGTYATGSTVPVNKSIDEIRRILLGAGATHYAFGEDPEKAAVQFGLDGRHYRFTVPRPTWEVVRLRFRDPRRVADQGAAVEAEWRRRWRARVLWIKAQVEFAADEPEVLHEAMLSHLVLPDGQTMGAWSEPQIEAMYSDGSMPPLLTSGERP